MKIIKRVVLGFIAGSLIFASVFIGVGELLIAPAIRAVGLPPIELQAKPVIITTSSGDTVSGWIAKGNPGNGVILLLHGVRGDRRSMLSRAKFLKTVGYSVMLIDLLAHGESNGKYITFGLNEANGVRAALSYLKKNFPDERIGVIGVSLGAASFVLSDPRPPPNAVVLESMYPTIREATTNRLVMRLGSIGNKLSPVLLCFLSKRLGISPEQLQPIAKIPLINAPLLIVSGSLDQHTTLAETKRIFQAAKQPKELWVVDGAAHIDLHHFNPALYETNILAFFERYLKKQLPT